MSKKLMYEPIFPSYKTWTTISLTPKLLLKVRVSTKVAIHISILACFGRFLLLINLCRLMHQRSELWRVLQSRLFASVEEKHVVDCFQDIASSARKVIVHSKSTPRNRTEIHLCSLDSYSKRSLFQLVMIIHCVLIARLEHSVWPIEWILSVVMTPIPA